MKLSNRLMLPAFICMASMAMGQAPTMYTVTAADPGFGPFSLGRGINDKGDSVSRSFDPMAMPLTGDIAGRLTKHGQYSVLSPVAGYAAAGPTAINNRGDAVGISGNNATDGTATLWKKNGQVVDLGTLPGWPVAIANEISNSGFVVGVAGTDVTSQAADGVPFRWHKGTMSEIIHPAYLFGAGVSVNSSGTAVGSMWNVNGGPGSDLVGFIADRFDNVSILPPLPGGSFMRLDDINNNGIAVGQGDSSAGLALGVFEHGIIYDTHTGTVTPVYPPAGFQIAALGRNNDAGTAIAAIVDVMVPNPQPVWAVYTNGQLIDVSTLVIQPPSSFWIILQLRDINSRGQISASAVDVSSSAPAPIAVILTPVPGK